MLGQRFRKMLARRSRREALRCLPLCVTLGFGALSAGCGLLSTGCGARLQNVKHGNFHGSKLFPFGNFVVVEVKSSTEGTFRHERYRMPGPFGPFERLIITSSGGKFMVTDKNVGNGAIEVNGKQYRVPLDHLVVIDERGAIRVVKDPRGRHPAIPKPISDSEHPHPK